MHSAKLIMRATASLRLNNETFPILNRFTLHGQESNTNLEEILFPNCFENPASNHDLKMILPASVLLWKYSNVDADDATFPFLSRERFDFEKVTTLMIDRC